MINVTKNDSKIATIFSLILIAIGLMIVFTNGQIAVAIPFLLFGGFWLIASLRLKLAAFAFGDVSAELGKSTATPLSWKRVRGEYRVGEVFDIEISYQLPSTLSIEALEVSLVKREIVWTNGKHPIKHNRDYVIQKCLATEDQLGSNETFEGVFQFQIPYDSIYSLDLKYNKVCWLIKLSLSSAEINAIAFEKPFIVLPELASG